MKDFIKFTEKQVLPLVKLQPDADNATKKDSTVRVFL